jgi:superfamily I DNA and/or RNA helicase
VSARAELAAQHRQLLQLERDAEIAENERLLQTCTDAELVARGATLLRLEVADLEPGFGGRLHAVLRPSRGGELPPHRFGPGAVVAMRKSRGDRESIGAVVVKVRRGEVVVALEDDEAELPSVVRVDRVATDVTFRRLDQALADLGREVDRERARFLDVLFGERDEEAAATAEVSRWFDPDLDVSQRDAVAFALAAPRLARIHGPPGTGKTTALVELCRQAIASGERLLACAPSNVAVDNLTERLAAAGLRVVRLGHPARMQPGARDLSLAAQVAASSDQKVLRDNRRDLDRALRAMQKAKGRQERFAARNELRQLRGERRQLERAITRGVVDGADVVLATTTGASEAGIGERRFDRVVLDEAGQALEAACWIPMQHAERVVLAGDHHQLPPTVISQEAARRGLSRTMFERLAEQPSTAAAGRMLTVQYRMHAQLMGWSSQTFYDGRLQAAPAVAAHLLTDLDSVVANEWTAEPLCFVDTAGCGHEETSEQDEASRHNPGEADLVARVVEGLLDAGVRAKDVAVITPYNAQAQRLRARLSDPALEIGTADGLQGREKEAVVVSLVRSNDRCEVGFLAELRRLNVALTRARRHLTVIGDSATIAADPGLCALVEHLQANGRYRSAFELA